jgi:hypothetical protein
MLFPWQALDPVRMTTKSESWMDFFLLYLATDLICLKGDMEWPWTII